MAPTDAPDPAPAAGISAPSPSTLIGGGAGASLSVIIVWGLQTYTHVTVPAMVAAALGAVLAAVAGYFPRGGNSSTTTTRK